MLLVFNIETSYLLRLKETQSVKYVNNNDRYRFKGEDFCDTDRTKHEKEISEEFQLQLTI
jgi:hypothetical protein